MEFPRYLEHIRADGDLVAAAAPRGLDRPIPACPGWDVREVVAHLATVYDHKVMAMRLGRRPAEGEWVTDEPYGKSTVEWFQDEHAKLLAELAAHSPGDPAWSFWPPDQTVGFWYRRMALETVVHRVDVETQFGPQSAIDSEFAIDGIDEVLMIMLPDDEAPETRGTIAIRCGRLTWEATFASTGITVQKGERLPHDAVVSGDPAELFLSLWGRAPIDALSQSGDSSLIAALRASLADGTQ